jgi:hypothetical protein
MMNHFAYGSNMLIAEIRRFVPCASRIGVARLPSYVLRFHKASKDGSAKCNAHFTNNPRELVIGALYQMDQGGLNSLAEKEGGYEERIVQVQVGDEKVHASIFVAKAARIDAALKPYDWYKELVIAGAEECGLPRSYIEQISSVEAVPDRNAIRSADRRSILPSTSMDAPTRAVPKLDRTRIGGKHD